MTSLSKNVHFQIIQTTVPPLAWTVEQYWGTDGFDRHIRKLMIEHNDRLPVTVAKALISLQIEHSQQFKPVVDQRQFVYDNFVTINRS